MASAVEEYLDRFEAVQRLTERINAVAVHLMDVSQCLEDDLQEARALISSEWPTADQLQALMTELENAKDRLALDWDKLPQRVRDAMPNKHPDSASVPPDQDPDED